MMRAVAVIPARAGSTRVKNKNFRPLNGTHLTEMAIAVAKDSGVFWKIFLSTDWAGGQELAEKHDVFLHRRSAAAASNSGTATDTMNDLREIFDAEGVSPSDAIFYLQPTSPLRTVEMIRASWEKLRQHSFVGVVSVVAVDPKYSKVLRINDGKIVSHFPEQVISSNQQEFEPLYLANGNIFAFVYGSFLERQTFPLLGRAPVIQDRSVSLDIDTEEEFESLFDQRLRGSDSSGLLVLTFADTGPSFENLRNWFASWKFLDSLDVSRRKLSVGLCCNHESCVMTSMQWVFREY